MSIEFETYSPKKHGALGRRSGRPRDETLSALFSAAEKKPQFIPSDYPTETALTVRASARARGYRHVSVRTSSAGVVLSLKKED